MVLACVSVSWYICCKTQLLFLISYIFIITSYKCTSSYFMIVFSSVVWAHLCVPAIGLWLNATVYLCPEILIESVLHAIFDHGCSSVLCLFRCL